MAGKLLDETGLAELWRLINKSGLANEYVWAKTKATLVEGDSATYTNKIVTGHNKSNANYDVYVYNTLTDAVLGNASSVVKGSSYSGDAAYGTAINNAVKGKYITVPDWANSTSYGLTIGFIPASATVSYSSSTGYIMASTIINYPNARYAEESFGYVNSPDHNAYPIGDGYTYTALGQLGNKVQIATGSYTGTGAIGSSNPNSLTFDFDPKIIFVFNRSEGYSGQNGIIWASDLTSSYTPRGYSYQELSAQNDYKAKKENNTVSWYYTGDSTAQMNTNGAKYGYIAIG